ncbi:MAG: substrate-binding domain-containing protein, partial [Pseudomonadota bacterium]
GTSMPRDHRARKRFEGLTEGLAKAGIEIEARDFYEGGSALAKGREMTASMLEQNPDLDFLYYSNDMIGAGGLLYLLEKGVDIPGDIGLAGFNGVELLQGLPRQLATTDACRLEIGRAAAEIIRDRMLQDADPTPQHITLTPKISYGDTLRRTMRT